MCALANRSLRCVTHCGTAQAAQRKEHIDQAKEIKENMEDLKEMSQDLNTQVVQDDDKIKGIEENIDTAEESIDTGNDHLVGVSPRIQCTHSVTHVGGPLSHRCSMLQSLSPTTHWG